MNRFLVITNENKDEDLKVTKEALAYIEGKGGICKTFIETEDGKKLLPNNFEDIDAVLVFGGDGTILRASSAMGDRNVPLLGINLGMMGFLAEVEPSNMYESIDRLFKDDYKIDERMHIKGSLIRDGKEIVLDDSLNDIVITREGYSRIICLKIYVNGQLLDIYKADGVVVATPTGSTGYSLSAGGPIVSPGTNVMVLTPVSPHMLTAKSIAFSGEDEITIEVMKKKKTLDSEAVLSFDGREGIYLSAGDKVVIRKATNTTRLIRMSDFNFYEVLRNKFSKMDG